MDEEVAKALVAASQQSAAMAQEAVKTLKEMKEKDGKKTGEGFATASKVVRPPEPFEPKNMEEEILQWQDWRLTYFKSWISFAEEAYNKEIEAIEGSDKEVKLSSMTKEEQARSEKLYAILVGLLRNWPLKLLRAVDGRNGYEVWPQLSIQLAPKTRSRSIALLQAFLNHPNFTKDKGMTMLEQLLGLERLAEEYGKVAKEDISDNTKLSVLLRVMPAAVRQHLQLQMTEDTTYEEAKEKMLAHERTTTSWGSQAIYKELAITKDHDKNDEVIPMDIDRVKGKEKGKGKGKDKGGKSKGKQKGKGYGNYANTEFKGKGKQYKGKDGKGKDAKGKGKGVSPDTCKLCGGQGHWSKECPMRALRQVSEPSSTVTTSVGDSASVAPASVAAPSTSSKNVRRVETVILDEDEEDNAAGHVRMVGTETYDLTYSDNDEDWIMFKDACESQGEAHFTGYEDLVEGGGSRPPKKGENKVNFVRSVAGGEGTMVIPDSGADVPVLPMTYREVGFPLERVTSLRDAQGGKMTN